MGSNGQAAAAVEQQQDWEDCKENYQPLKSGRKPGALKENLLSEKKVSIEEQRRCANAQTEQKPSFLSE